MPSSRRTLESAGEPVASLEALSDALRTRGWIARVITWPREPACVVVQDPCDGAVSGRVLAVRDTLTGTWWYWFGRAEPLATAGRPAAAAAVVGQILAGSARWPDRPGDPGGLARHAQAALPPRVPRAVPAPVRGGLLALGEPGAPAAETMTMAPGRALAALRAELASCGLPANGMTITRLQGILTPASGPSVGYRCGWLMWPAGRLSRRGRPVYSVHRAGDPAGAARRLTRTWLTGDQPGGPGGQGGFPVPTVRGRAAS
jgi:hypothetical protein